MMVRALSLFCMLAFCLPAQATTETYTLDNGLKVVVREDHRAPVAVVQLWYRVGSSYETLGSTGISHALEHMMFKGTSTYPEGVFSKLISENGGENNAFTSYDYTAYYEKLPSHLLPLSFKLEADRMQHLLLQKEAFDKEKNVVIEERLTRTDDNPENLAYERFMTTAQPGSPYQHPVIGWMDDIKDLDTEKLKHWYQTWYVPNNAILVVVGDVKAEAVRDLAQEHFGKIPRGTVENIKPKSTSPTFGKRQVEMTLTAKVPRLYMGFNVPSATTAEESWEPYALEVISYLLNGGMSSRLNKELVRGAAVAADVNAGYQPYALHATLFTLTGLPSVGKTLPDLELAFQQQISRLQTEPVATAELERVKTNVMADHLYQKDSMFYQAYEIGALESVGFSWNKSEEYLKEIQAITPEQIQMVAKKYFVPERLTLTSLYPQQAQSEGA